MEDYIKDKKMSDLYNIIDSSKHKSSDVETLLLIIFDLTYTIDQCREALRCVQDDDATCNGILTNYTRRRIDCALS